MITLTLCLVAAVLSWLANDIKGFEQVWAQEFRKSQDEQEGADQRQRTVGGESPVLWFPCYKQPSSMALQGGQRSVLVFCEL